MHGRKLFRLARKHFDKFTSEISPSYENSLKSSVPFMVHMRRKVFSCTAISLVDRQDLSITEYY